MNLREEIRATLTSAKNPYAGPDNDIRIIGRQEVDELMKALEPVIARAEQEIVNVRKAARHVLDRHSGFDVTPPQSATEAQMRQCQCDTCADLYAALLRDVTPER